MSCVLSPDHGIEGADKATPTAVSEDAVALLTHQLSSLCHCQIELKFFDWVKEEYAGVINMIRVVIVPYA